MNKLLSTIESSINNTINEYNLLISEKFNIDVEELKNIWTSTFDGMVKQSKKSSKTVSEKSSVTGGDDDIKCIYKFIKGKQQGENCNKSTKNGTQFCSKHSKFETDGQKDKKPKLPKIESKSPDRIIKLNKELNKWWHKESKLVFKSSKDKVVVGTYKNDEYKQLTKDDISDCEKYGFKYELEEDNNIDKKTVEKKKETVIKPVEKKKETVIKPVEKKSLTEHINTTNLYAKNVEDIISDMLKDSDDEKDDESEEEEEQLEEQLDEEY
jgi:hypothetical protein